MLKYYYINESCQAYMVIEGRQRTYIDLSYEDTKMFLSNLNKSSIKDVRKNGDTLRTTFDNDITVVIATAAFTNRYHMFESQMSLLRERIRNYLEKRRLQAYKQKKGKHVKVNRKKGKSIGPILIASGAAFTIGAFAWLALNFPENSKDVALKDDNDLKTEDIDTLFEEIPQSSYNKFMEGAKDIQMPKTEEPVSEETAITETEITALSDSYMPKDTPIESQYTFELEFSDKTGNGKYAETEQLYGAAIKKYAPHFGIPYNVACAYISQERPDNGDPNVCQITGSIDPFSVDIYDENGPTGKKEVIEVTDAAKTDPTESIRIGLAYLRFSIDYIDSFTTGLFGYNQGPYAVDLACDYYGLDKENYKGEENSQKACELIINYFKDITEPGKVHGDPNYLSNVFGYLPLEDRSSATIECYVNGELKQIAISNQLYYNNGQTRG